MFPNGTMFIFETFTAMPEDWTALFSLVDGEHTIVVSFDGADDRAGIYALLGIQFGTNCQKKNKDPLVKAIHFNAYHLSIITASSPMYTMLWGCFLMTHWMPPKSTTLPRQSLLPFTTSLCRMFYPPTLPIEYIPLYRKSPFP
uniref:Uncharacterized protein n=1 Tax=Romanomermis culicivorax TaxID=13658 RepID=A0A915JGW3_ROMCU